MTEHHHFVQHFLRPGDYVSTKFTCTAPEGSKCRMHCKTCSDEQREACECNYLGDLVNERLPDMQDIGFCLVTHWLNEDAPEETFDGERQPVRGPDPQPFVESWDGDNFGWDYAT